MSAAFPSSFEEAAREYAKIIAGLAHSYSLSANELDDLYQEGLIALHRAFLTYEKEGKASFSTYAGKCIRNSMVSWIRKNRLPKDITVENLDGETDTLLSKDNPENEVISAELYRMLKESALSLLSKREGEIFELVICDKKNSEIAAELKLSSKAVENALYRIKTKLRKGLKL